MGNSPESRMRRDEADMEIGRVVTGLLLVLLGQQEWRVLPQV
jgi:hypothetical protein